MRMGAGVSIGFRGASAKGAMGVVCGLDAIELVVTSTIYSAMMGWGQGASSTTINWIVWLSSQVRLPAPHALAGTSKGMRVSLFVLALVRRRSAESMVANVVSAGFGSPTNDAGESCFVCTSYFCNCPTFDGSGQPSGTVLLWK